MKDVREALRMLLPRGMGPAVLSDLERELALRQSARGKRWTDTIWLARVGFTIAVRLRFAAVLRQASRAVAAFATELRLATKGLGRNPGLALAGVAVLALGVAAPTVTYSFVAAHLRPFAVPNWEELVTVSYLTRDRPSLGHPLSGDELRLLREEPRGVLHPIAGLETVTLDLSGEGGEAIQVRGARVTHDVLDVLSLQPIQGRSFGLDDADETVALVGEHLWRSRFGADPTLLGRSIRINGAPHTVVGILPDVVRFPSGAQVWVPAQWGPTGEDTPSALMTIARLPDGVPLDRADDDVRAVLAERSSQGAREDQGYFAVSRLAPRLGVSPAEDRPILLGLLALVTGLLLIASANVANLFVCRAISRRHALAVRAALGAGRARLVATHVVEAAVIATLGGIVGVLIAIWAIQGIGDVFTFDGTRWWRDMRVEPGMFWFALTLIALAALLAGLVPALRTAGGDVEATLRGDARGGGVPRLGRITQTLIVAEVALSVPLVLQAFLSIAPVLELPGSLEAREVLAAGYTLRADERSNDQERLAFHRGLVERLTERPGVTGAALVAPLPGRPGLEIPVLPTDPPPGDAENADGTSIVLATPRLFEVLGVPLLQGRELRWSDGETASLSILVNEAYVERYFRGEEALGRQLTFALPGRVEPTVATVVGVSPTLGILVADGERPDAIYLPINASLPSDVFLVASTPPGGNPLEALPEARSALAALDPDKPFHTIGTPQSLFHQQWAPLYGMAGLLGLTGLAGLLIAGIGLFAVMAFSVAGRTRELGLRIALGASEGRVMRAVLGRAALWMTQGLLVGLGLALAFRPRVAGSASLAEEPYLLPFVAAVLLATGLVAAAVPATHAVRVEPSVALRAE